MQSLVFVEEIQTVSSGDSNREVWQAFTFAVGSGSEVILPADGMVGRSVGEEQNHAAAASHVERFLEASEGKDCAQCRAEVITTE